MLDRRGHSGISFLSMGLVAGGLMAAVVAVPDVAFAMQFKYGNADISFDTTISAGAAMRTSGRKCMYISVANPQGCANDGLTDNYDDGNLNYDKWDVFSAPVSGLSELEVKLEDLGFFLRGSYFFDAIQSDKESTRRTDLTDAAVSRVGRRARLLDAYVYGDVDMGIPVHFRLGNQVINWGESIFYGGGIAETNAFDVTKLRGAGAEIKEAFLPAPMALARFAPVSNLDVSAYYQFRWNETELDPVGTFFSLEDAVGPGAVGLFYGPAFGGFGDPAASGVDAPTQFLLGTGIPLVADQRPSHSGQWGISALYFSEMLQTELGLYYMRYHQKVPVVGAFAACDPIFGCYPTAYFRNYVSDQDLFGASASFVWQDISFGVDVAYQPDYAIPLADPFTAAATTAFLVDPVGFTGTAVEQGFIRENRTQTILNALYSAGPAAPVFGTVIRTFGMDDITFIGEMAWTHFDSKPAGTFGHSDAVGYILDITGSYQGVFGTPWVLYPGLSFRHDVNGTALDYAMTDSHIDARRQVTLRLNADYQSTWALGVSYTRNSGGGYMNFSRDRDFATLTVSYAF
ncbi:DUF1302 domain-containing protein [Parvibaculum sp.]|uniref:DUF1302 domain-containing protein n=1 Tax=Parvibaculum sp. TaxID=2024848 RepID=UPI001E191947|nr:DUF1302 domain-containing protein [Parvibaculum sp.]MBX3489175.1 DUF1302 domain-containing protein [Parvibaculum sp.]MCW5726953.1 DUF1302 domain-containing protein [Parvibaculum sp.]